MSQRQEGGNLFHFSVAGQMTAVVDNADKDLAKRGGWYLHPQGMLCRSAYKGRWVKHIEILHRMVYERAHPEESPLKRSVVVVHVDGDPLNNRRDNLRRRRRTMPEAKPRKVLRSDNTSGYLGISFYHGKARAFMKVDGRNIYLGFRDTAEQAYLELRQPAEARKARGEPIQTPEEEATDISRRKRPTDDMREHHQI